MSIINPALEGPFYLAFALKIEKSDDFCSLFFKSNIFKLKLCLQVFDVSSQSVGPARPVE